MHPDILASAPSAPPILQPASAALASPDLSPALSPDVEDARSGARLWRPKRVLLTRAARLWPRGTAIAERAAALGAEVVELQGDRLVGLATESDPRAAYRLAKSTLAVTVASPAKRRPQPIPPSADWRFDLAEGCPAHCQYCYLAGSLAGPPVTRAYANLEEILGELPGCLGHGAVTSADAARSHEGTTYEASCYTDPLGIEHLTGSLADAVRFFGRWDAAVQLRFTTKFADVAPLLGLDHGGRVRVRLSLTIPPLMRFEGGTSPLPARIAALGRLARAGYRIGLTVAPIQPVEGWEAAYAALFADIARALQVARAEGAHDPDLTAEFITHRFTPKSKGVLTGWYPGSTLDMDEAARSRKLTKFGSVKHVYPSSLMKTMRAELTASLAAALPQARVLYWT